MTAEEARRLGRETGLSFVTATALLARGVTDRSSVRAFLDPDLDRDWRDPWSLPGLPAAADTVADAVRSRQRIVVFGDFDVDGISAAAVATLGLRELGADVEALVPHRFREGYGLGEAALRRVLALGPRLVITVDCGISSASEVATLRAAGAEVVVTDHHQPGEGLPEGVPIVDPKLHDGEEYPFEGLAGAGVALKVVAAAGARLGRPDVWRSLTDVAALGTIADIVPMLDENRALTADGLRRLREGSRPSVSVLARLAGIDPATLTADDVAYGIAPRLNAAGRIGDPAVALELLLTEDRERAEELAGLLDEYNRLRQLAEADLTDEVMALARRRFDEGDRLLMLAGEGWHEGVKGIVASRLAARFGVPVMLFCIRDGLAVASGRSVAGVDLYEALSSCADLLVRFGGHAGAVGATVRVEDLAELESRLARELERAQPEAFVATEQADAEVRLDSLSPELLAELSFLAPHGVGNPKPLLVSRCVFMGGRKRVGRDGAHLAFTAFDADASVASIAFRCPDIEALSSHEAPVDLLHEVVSDEWKGRMRVRLHVRDLMLRPSPPDSAAGGLVDELFAHAEAGLASGEYAGIGEAGSFHTKLAGVTFEGRQEVVARLRAGTPLRLERQPANSHDGNACALFDPTGRQVGFFNRRLAAALAPLIDDGLDLDVEVTEVTGGVEGRSFGVNVLVSRRGTYEEEAKDHEAGLERRSALAALAPEDLDGELVRHFIGDRPLLEAQALSLTHLGEGRSCLTVMATGRGKSLVFHLHAARLAIASGWASVFVYPLRALVSDQAFYLEEVLAEVGVSCAVVNGETSPEARDRAFASLADGSLDVVLTTPEFLVHHAARFAESRRVGFVVVDEAHHVASARARHRPAYGRLGEVLEALGMPVVLAVTATAGDETARVIAEVLGIEERVLDPSVRANLRLQDRRGAKDRRSLVASLVARGEKTVAYVNSREGCVKLAGELRRLVPEAAGRIAFYNGGLTRPVRHAIERSFREGELVAVVATSAFGEGVNIPDVRHVVLYHLPFDAVEFNQTCGRAGRDGLPATVHLMFSARDSRLNELVLAAMAPKRDDLAKLYLVLKDAPCGEEGLIEVTNGELAAEVERRRPRSKLGEKGVSSGLGILRELGLLTGEGAGSYRRLWLTPPTPGTKLDLGSSVRYQEGRGQLDAFTVFKGWVLRASAQEMLDSVNRPILPSEPTVA